MVHGRKRLATALSGLALVACVGAVGFVPAQPAQAEPKIDDVQQRVDTLFHEAEQASERLNDAKLELGDLQSDLVSLQADQERQHARLEAARENLQDSIVSSYEGQSLSAVGVVADTDDATSFVSNLSTMSAYNDMQSQLFTSFATESKALDLRAKATEQRAAEIEKKQAELAADKKAIDDKYEQAKALLDKLKAEEREALLSRGSVRMPSGVDASGRAAIAIRYAMAQVGKSYVYGAAGPNAFDCSGLMMMAWAQAGISLPHSSGAQYGVGHHVSSSDLQPGDLVFYYSPISHVAMYIGNGLIVEAANPGAGIRVSPVFSMPYVGATRLV
ncbi:MAG TPA: NlpC/P60 family protein [Nocardioides sp.]|uniref:C40 family peptidase n=1 Tax=Nocardioides sp. TaxID=35761 RepID=UPI002E3423C4|nr:NlpC/P60 family protein [Nocardioides sp.]HEX5088312.1 NlpC/P60 family protein [Nocardioides sp.]